MESPPLLKLITILGIGIMIISFVVVPDDYPWYYELLLLTPDSGLGYMPGIN